MLFRTRARTRSTVALASLSLAALLVSCVPPAEVDPEAAGVDIAVAPDPADLTMREPATTVTTAPEPSAPDASAPATTAAPTTTAAPAAPSEPSAPTTTAPAAPAPTVPPAGSCGEASCAPRGDLAGWRQTFVDDFGTAIPAGSFPQATNGRWGAYDDGWTDSSRRGRYRPSAISVSDGKLRLPVGTVDGQHRVAAAYPKVPGVPGRHGGQLHGRFAIRMRADVLPGYKFASLLWPDSENWPHDGEIDYPEGELNGQVAAFTHRKGATVGSDQDWFHAPGGTYANWHTYVIEWGPSAIVYYYDGVEIGRSTSRLPDTYMHWVLQAETSLTQSTIPTWAAGQVEIDWVAVWSRA